MTGYTSPERGNQVEGRRRQGYQREGPAYHIDYDKKLPYMIDNQLSSKTHQVQNMTPQYQQQDAVMQQYQQ